jgi:hypothetical protein
MDVAMASPPTKFLFDAVDVLSKKYLVEKWTGSIKFRCLPVLQAMVGSPLDKTSVEELDICNYLNSGRALIARQMMEVGAVCFATQIGLHSFFCSPFFY